MKKSRKTERPLDSQGAHDKANSSCIALDTGLSFNQDPLSAKLAPMSACQETLLAEYLSAVGQKRRECHSLLAKLASDSKSAREKKVLELKTLERDLHRRMEDIESGIDDAIKTVKKRIALIEDMEYDIKYKQARYIISN